MRARWRRFSWACAIVVAAAIGSLPQAHAAGPTELQWEQLIPESLRHDAARNLVSKILPQRRVERRTNVSLSRQSDLVTDYDGRRIKLSGFIVPFNNDEPPYKRLLLIPFSGACVKFPPPRNQAVLLALEKGIRLTTFFDRVVVTGVMSVAPTKTDIAEVGYRITAETVEPQE